MHLANKYTVLPTSTFKNQEVLGMKFMRRDKERLKIAQVKSQIGKSIKQSAKFGDKLALVLVWDTIITTYQVDVCLLEHGSNIRHPAVYYEI